jgi:succinate dehydrogenase/fumarate reductase flavoprotein subunit
VGGFDGANRAGGNALTAVTVLSQLTGERAAADVAAGIAGGGRTGDADAAAALACGSLASLVEVWQANAAASGAVAAIASVGGAREHLQAIVGEALGVVRSPDELAACLTGLAGVRGSLAQLAPASASERLQAAELPGMLLTAELVAAAALQREESRGGHFRTDHPDESPAWTRHIVIEPAAAARAGEIRPAYTTRLAEVGKVSPPAR